MKPKKLPPMKREINIDDEQHMFLDRYYFSKRSPLKLPRSFVGKFGGLENTILHSCDGIEARIAAKDALWKLNNEMVKRYGRGFNLKLRLIDQQNCRIPWHTQKRLLKIAKELDLV
jgi:hypothetical protein